VWRVLVWWGKRGERTGCVYPFFVLSFFVCVPFLLVLLFVVLWCRFYCRCCLLLLVPFLLLLLFVFAATAALVFCTCCVFGSVRVCIVCVECMWCVCV